MKSLRLVSLVACFPFISLFAVAQEESAPAGNDSAAEKAAIIASLPVERAVLTAAPHVPPPITRKYPARVVVHLEVKELVRKLADGVEYTFWTFGGEVPGLFIRVREGDVVEFNLHNHPSSKLPHNIDLHAVTGPGGGAAASLTAPGHSSTFSFQALNPGLFVYHCATAPVPLHVANGMYGLILVEPREGMRPVSREYYVMQSEVYTSGKFGEPGPQTFDAEKAIDERPPYVVLNGSVGALTGDNALTAEVGETVRLYVGNGGPNLTSSFHVIGAVFDNVHQEGGSLANQLNVQTTVVPPGGAAIVEFSAKVPGSYPLVDHALFRAFNKGTLGMLKVTGPANALIYSGKESDALYSGQLPAIPVAAAPAPVAPKPAVPQPKTESAKTAPDTLEAQLQRGQKVFMATCFACHGMEGKGVPSVFPPLAGSDYLKADKERPVRIVAKGLTGPVTVNGVTYNNVMPPQELTHEQIADVLTFVNNSWGNKNGTLSPEDVKRLRAAMP
jgi:nitrite reductase (NO-forming)